MYSDQPPKLWTPPKPAIIRAASLDEVRRAMPVMTTFAAASAGALRKKGGGATSAVAGISVMAPNSGGYGGFMCTQVVFRYSDDNSAYTTHDTWSGLSFSDNEKKTRTFSPPAAKHRYFRFEFTGQSNAAWEIGELEILNASNVDLVPTMSSNTTSGVTVTGSHDSSNAFVAFQDSNTAAGATWWGALPTSTVIMTVDLGVAT